MERVKIGFHNESHPLTKNKIQGVFMKSIFRGALSLDGNEGGLVEYYIPRPLRVQERIVVIGYDVMNQ